MRRHLLALIAVALVLPLSDLREARAAPPPSTWDNLVLVRSKRLDLAYLLPGADFRAYNKVMFDPAEVAFKKNWMRDLNSSTRELSKKIDDKEAAKIAERARTGMNDIFAKAYVKAGYTVVTHAGPDVLRVSPMVINLYINAPEALTMGGGRSRVYTVDAGEATLVLEVRDSETGAVLGRAVDRRIAGQDRRMVASSVSNTADFGMLFRQWADASLKGLQELKTLSPVNTAGLQKK